MHAEQSLAGKVPAMPTLGLAITEHAPLPIAMVDGETHVVRYANPAFCALMHQPLASLVGRPMCELLPARDECVTMLDRVFRTKKAQRHTEKETANPHPVFWSYTMWPMEAAEQFIGIMIQVTETARFHETTLAMNEALLVGSVRQHGLTAAAENLNARLWDEIDAREMITAELSQRNRELAEKARLLDLTYDAIIVRDIDGSIRYWNHGAEDLYGWSREAALGKKSHLLLQTEFPEPSEQIAEEMDRTGRWIGELVHIARDSRRVTVLARQTLDRASAGHPASVLEILTDITARKRAEQQFRGLLEFAPDSMIITDARGRITLINAQTELLFGFARDELIGKPIEILIPPRFRDRHPAHRHDYLAHPRLRPMGTGRDLWALRKDGSEFPVEISLSPLATDDGILVISNIRDITERRRLEDALAKRAADLVQADRSKDEFLAMLAHELRNPLAPLRSATAILQAPGATAEATEQALEIQSRQIENMSAMVDDLLDVSRIVVGKIELRTQVVALEAVLNVAASLVRPGIEARNQKLTVTLPAEPVFLNADATRLDQVFGNLLTNASKYSGPGSHISVSAERAEPRGEEPPEVIVRVLDNGIGIAPELLPRVFDLFVQASRSLDRANGGLGIGLTLVQRLVKLHGGSVEARSEGLGHGSEFIVRLPILNAAAAPVTPPAAPTEDIPRRILIVDDNEDAALSMATLQGLRGHATRTAFNGPEALTAAAEFLPNVVLLDIGLPGMDGYEVARQLRAMPALAGAFLVALSGYGSDEDRARAQQAGFDEYLVKPPDNDLLRIWMLQRG